MSTRITVIVDNKADNGLSGEWGLSILIEKDDVKVLLDTGGSDLFATNMAKLGYDIADVDYAVLSHAHYDHSLGMRKFFESNSKAKFYLRESAAENCYAGLYIFKKYIGIPKHITKDHKDRIEYVSGDYRLCDGVYLIPHKTPGLEKAGMREKMLVKRNRKWQSDDFSHE